MVVVHLTASRCFGGPERQMLGLALALSPAVRSVLVSFGEDGNCTAFLGEAARQGVEAIALRHDTPHLWAAGRELAELLHRVGAEVICCHGYKANLLGCWAARRTHIPALAVSRGWTGESLRVRLYEAIDRLALRWLDRVVCVSAAQAERVCRAGVPVGRTTVIANAIRVERFGSPDPRQRAALERYFRQPPRWLVGSAGRLSPEKGFEVLLDAAVRVAKSEPRVGLVIFGDGPLRDRLQLRIESLGLQESVVLAGFRDDLDRVLPCLDLFVLPSFTEGMPNVILEAMAARVPVVATAVGGTPELVEEGTGCLVPAGDPIALADSIGALLRDVGRRHQMGQRGRRRVEEHFTFAAQARKYCDLFRDLCASERERARATAEVQPSR